MWPYLLEISEYLSEHVKVGKIEEKDAGSKMMADYETTEFPTLTLHAYGKANKKIDESYLKRYHSFGEYHDVGLTRLLDWAKATKERADKGQYELELVIPREYR